MPINDTVQLTRIIAPNLSEIDYGSKLQEVFDNINENFKKVASMPFVQGVQGDSYTLVVKHVFEKGSNNNMQVTTEGAELLNSIFQDGLDPDKEPIKAEDNLETCKGKLKQSLTLNGVTPLDIFNTVETDNVCNNLYFYAIIDDLGVEQNKYLGQLYYFIDARVSAVADARIGSSTPSALNTFSDFSGFYMYRPENDPVYYKTDIIPTIYYDSTRDDICWKLNGKNTGISAVGAKGEDGTDATLQFVKCKVTFTKDHIEAGQLSADVDAVFKPITPDPENPSTPIDPWSRDQKDFKKLEKGLALICIAYDDGSYGYAFGSIIVNKPDQAPVTATAFWSSDTIVQGMVTDTAIINFFDRVGLNDGASIKALRIPAETGTDPQTFHTLGINNPNNETVIKDVLIQRQTLETNELKRDIGNSNPDSNIIVDNYNIKLERQIDSIGSKPSVILSDTGIELKNEGETKIKLSNGDSNVLEVRGGVDMNPDNGAHFTTDVQFSGKGSYTIRSGADNDLKPLIINASQVTIGNGNSPRLEVLGDIQTPVTRQTISYIDNDIFFKPNTWGTTDQTRFTHNIVAKGENDSLEETFDGNTQYGGPGSQIRLAAESIVLDKKHSNLYKTNVIARADVYMASNETRAYGSDETPGDVPDPVACLSSAGTIRNVAYTQFLGPSWEKMSILWGTARAGRAYSFENYVFSDNIGIPWEYLASNDYTYIMRCSNGNGGYYIGYFHNLKDFPDGNSIINSRILGIIGRMGIYLNDIVFADTNDSTPGYSSRIAIINPNNNSVFKVFIYALNVRVTDAKNKQRLLVGTWTTSVEDGRILTVMDAKDQIVGNGSAQGAELLVTTDSSGLGHTIAIGDEPWSKWWS